MQAPHRSSLMLAALGVLAVGLLAALAWKWDAPGTAATAVSAPEIVSGETPRSTGATVERIRGEDAAPARSQRKPDSDAAGASTAPDAQDALPVGDAILLLADFISPDGQPLEPASVHARLLGSDGVVLSASSQRDKTIRIEGLRRQAYTLDLDAPGFVHRPQTFDLSKDSGLRPNQLGELVRQERAMLWPAGWVAIVVQTSDGRPIRSLSEVRNISAAQLFAGAFEARARNRPADGSEFSEAQAGPQARFIPPLGYQAWDLPGDCIGSLECIDPPPYWVELRLYGSSAGCERLAPGQSELVFRLDQALLESRLARVRLRIVEPDGTTPVVGAQVALNANLSVHRRAEQADTPSGQDGRVEFTWIVPGHYELRAMRGQSQHQQMLQLQAGEVRELGDIVLANSAGLEVLTLDQNGQAISAFVEITPYVPGARSGELFPQQLRYSTPASGLLTLPTPSGPSVLRASQADWRSGSKSAQEISGTRSANVLVDPSRMARGPLRLTLQWPVAVQLATSRPQGARLEVLDELDLVVARSPAGNARSLAIELIPGRYRARARSAEDVLSPERPFVVAGEPLQVPID